MLSLHNVTTLKNWQHCFEFVSEKMIQQLFIIIIDVEITDLNATTAKSSKKEFQLLIEFYKLVNSKHQISQQIQDHHLDKSDSVFNVDIIHKTMLKYN